MKMVTLNTQFGTWLATALIPLFLSACALGPPSGVTPAENFSLDRYLGTWYEIARLDHSFERDMSDVSARYSRNADGSVRVLNRGYDTARMHGAMPKAKHCSSARAPRARSRSRFLVRFTAVITSPRSIRTTAGHW